MTVIEQTIEQGGGTFNPVTLAPVTLTSGYAVAVAALGAKVPVERFTANAVAAYVRSVGSTGGTYLGTWLDNGTVYLDTVFVTDDYDRAMRVATESGELAIYDFATGQEVRTANGGQA